jgi:hypothetical protein
VPERFEIRITPELKDRLIEEAERESISLAELIVRLVCRALDFPEAKGVPVKRPPGRRPKKHKRK